MVAISTVGTPAQFSTETIASTLRTAMREDRIWLAYQPVVSCGSS